MPDVFTPYGYRVELDALTADQASFRLPDSHRAEFHMPRHDWDREPAIPVDPGVYIDSDGEVWQKYGTGTWKIPTGQFIPPGTLQDRELRIMIGGSTLTRLETRAKWAQSQISTLNDDYRERHYTPEEAAIADAAITAWTQQREEQTMTIGTTRPNTLPDPGPDEFDTEQHEVDRIANLSPDEFPNFIEDSTIGALGRFLAMTVRVGEEHDRRGRQAQKLRTRIIEAVEREAGNGSGMDTLPKDPGPTIGDIGRAMTRDTSR